MSMLFVPGVTNRWTEVDWTGLDWTGQCVIIGASLSEPHTSESNGGFFIYYIYIYIYLPYVRRSVNAG